MKADKAFINGVIYTAGKKDKFAEAIAIKGNKIIFVGRNDGVNEFIGTETQVIDIKGGMILPGMQDNHTHPPGNKLYELYDMDFYGVKSIDKFCEIVTEFIKNNPDEPAYYGSGLVLSMFTEGEEAYKGPRKEFLDKLCKDKPLIINTRDMHSVCANSKAFEVAGIDRNTEDPVGGRFERVDETGEPWGVCREKMAADLLPMQEFSKEQRKKGIMEFQKMMHERGVTGIISMPGKVDVSEDMAAMAKDGTLKLRTSAAYYVWPENVFGTTIDEQMEAAKWQRENWNDCPELFKVTTIKFAADGVVEGLTAAVIDPYEEGAQKDADYHGEFLFTDDEMKKICRESNELGFQIHVHSIGDLSTRTLLDIFEEVRDKGIKGDFRNTLTHLQLVAPEDIERFRELDVIAATHPFWHLKEPVWYDEIEVKFLGDRAETEYPFKSFFDAGVTVTSSSDHGATENPNPFIGIECGVTRNLINASDYKIDDIVDMDDPKYLLNSAERGTLEEVIDSFTINGAYQGFRENEIGSLEVGKFADMVIIEKNLFEMNPVDIEHVQIQATIFDGEFVYVNDASRLSKEIG